jgi:uncharacterized membrane protein YeaQ/YmgE (transglycosylase-associated protein family)
MQSFLYLVLGTLIGALASWVIYAGFYIEYKQFPETFGIRVLKEPLPKSFWRVTRYVALLGGLIGAAIVVVERFV